MEPRDIQIRGGRDAHLAATREHVDRPVVVRAEIHAERRGRLAELLDLLRERLDLLAFTAKGVGELLVLRHRAGELIAGLDELLFEERDLPRRVGQTPAQKPDLLLQELHLGLELVNHLLVPLDLLVVTGHLRHLPRRAGLPVYVRSLTRPVGSSKYLFTHSYGTSAFRDDALNRVFLTAGR